MGKLFNSMMMGVMIVIALFFFNGSGMTPTSLVSLLLNPSGWENNEWYLLFSGLATLSGGILVGLATIIRQDWLARAGIIVTLNSIVIAPFVDLFRFVVSQTNYVSVCTNSPICSQLNSIGGIGQVIALVFVGPMFLYAMWACISWVFSPESSG